MRPRAGPMARATVDAFVSCLPGLEPWLALDLERVLGDGKWSMAAGGAELDQVSLDALVRVRRESGVVTACLRRLAKPQPIRALGELQRKAAAFPWREWLGDLRVHVIATSHQSRVYHKGAVVERICNAAAIESAASDDADSTLLVRFDRDMMTLSINEDGASALYRRGYRLASAKAPLREDIANALVRASLWSGNGGEALLDPFCGSGTIAIEAAMFAYGIAPGRLRVALPGDDVVVQRNPAIRIFGARARVCLLGSRTRL